jgi:uncharacterized protein YdeI (YjbR/CyaY-like superfamily)
VIDMPSRSKILEVKTAAQWRAWLASHHDSAVEVWLVFHKRHTNRASIPYEDAVNEALCFGWIDSLVKRLDDDRYARKFTPRRAGSRWSTANRERYARLEAGGRLMPAGRELAPADRNGDAPHPSPGRVPRYIQRALASRPPARDFFQGLAPSYRRMYVGWIEAARKPETRMRRLQEAVRSLAAGRKPGLK